VNAAAELGLASTQRLHIHARLAYDGIMLQSAAKIISGTLGRESRVIRSVRPVYERALDLIYKHHGMPWVINGLEYRIEPYHRHRLGSEYDASVAAFFRTRLRDGYLCFDVGANVGVYVLQFAQWCQPSGRVVAFEPNDGARKVLKHHIQLNGIEDRVTIVPAAVGSTSGKATLYAADADGMSRLNAPNVAIASRVRPVEVAVVSVDEYIEQSGLKPDVLMVDIEGFEIQALSGAKTLIQEKRDLLIVVEMHPNVWSSANTNRQSTEALLDDLQLTPVALQGQSDALVDHGIVHLQQRERL
jgi:FkbM family methyltransferase